MMIKKWGVLILAIFFIFTACKPLPQEAVDHTADVVPPISAPVEYNATDMDDELASVFVQHMIARNFKAASRLLSKDFRAVYQAEWYQSRSKGLQDYWNYFTGGLPLMVSQPGLYPNDPLTSSDLYFYPASVGNQRVLLQVGVRNDQVAHFSIDEEFELIERLLHDLVNEEFEDVDKINQEHSFQIMASSEDVRQQWKKILSQTGKYLSSDPPYAKLIFDATPYHFPSTFENGRYAIVIISRDLHPQTETDIVFCVTPISD